MAIYDPEIWDNKKSAAQIGGENRAKTARRDRWGRFIPHDRDLPAPVCHGKSGGDRLMELYGREYFARIAKKRGLKPCENMNLTVTK